MVPGALRRARPPHEGPDRGPPLPLTHDPDGAVRFTTTGPQGSGILSSMAGAQGLFFVPPQYPGGDAGTEMLVMLLAGSGAERPPFPVPPG